MHHIKKLILFILVFSFTLGESIPFRGKIKEDLLGQRIPLAFVNMVSNNYNILPSQINPQRGSYMIIAPDGVVNYLNDFVSFKNSQGFDVYLIPLSEAGGSAAEIKSMITDRLMDDPMLEYILLIGDVDGFAEFPSFYYGPENDVSDQQYTHILGDDNIPDVFIGRLSIDSLSDLAVIMSKTIQYTRDPLAFDENWLDRGLIVAGNYANTYPIPITPKWTSYWLRDELLDYGYSEVDTVFYPPIQQGAPYIIPMIDNGVGIVNYRGWGDANGWHYPEFHVDDVNDLNNGWLTPVFMSYVCNSNDFANNVDPCLAEAVLRGGTPTVPKGGVAFVGPSDLHTSTKYNNVINAYMYDAMLNYNVVELGPAMQAGQWGLTKEFPAQSGAGEAQEFYANVYNILGDPSLQVYLDTPKEFTITSGAVTSVDNFINISLSDPHSQPVSNAVISIMTDGALIEKGISDKNGQYATILDIEGTPALDIYANKGGFIQGHEIVYVQNSDQDLVLSDINIGTQDNSVKPMLGSLMDISISFQNQSSNSLGPISCNIAFSDHVVPSMFNVNIPTSEPGETVTINGIEITAYGTDVSNAVIGVINSEDGSTLCDLAIDIEMPVFEIEFTEQPEPGDEFQASLSVVNFTQGNYSVVSIQLTPLSEGATLSVNGSSEQLSSFNPFESSLHETNYILALDDVSYGSDITFLVEFFKNGYSFYEQEVVLALIPPADNYPVAPNNFGYWAYDDTDEGYEQTPVFEWVELDPNYGGSNGTHYELDDDDHVDVELPFVFKYHGRDYDQITISSNGWTSFEGCDIDYFWNMSIPMYMGPKAMLAPFSDDLETIDTNGDGQIDKWVDIYTWHDDSNGRFIIEWSRALNGYDEVTEETFEIILYDQNAMPTESGNGVIDFQYLEIDDVDVTKNYSTVGIEAPDKNYGLQYVFNNVYTDGAAPLENERAIRFTTEAPSNYISALDVDNDITPEQFYIGPAYPNPFNPITNIDLTIPMSDEVSISIFDILGKEVSILHNGTLVSGHYRFTWNGVNRYGHSLSSGTYFVMVRYRKNIEIRKLLLLK